MSKDFMTVKGIGKKEGTRLYREFNGDEEGVLYYEDKVNKLLIRQILPIPQDIELVRKTRKIAAEELIVTKTDENGRKTITTMDKVLPVDTDEEILKLIIRANPQNNDDGSISITIFNMVTKEFIAILDVEPIPDTESKEAGILFTFSRNKIIRKRYGEKVKRIINNLLKEDGMYPNGCKEVIWTGKDYVLIPIN